MSFGRYDVVIKLLQLTLQNLLMVEIIVINVKTYFIVLMSGQCRFDQKMLTSAKC